MIDDEALYVERPGTIRTWSGKRVDPLDMKPADLSIEDIAHSLARSCRYNGHVGGFLSVARHSLLVSERLEKHYPELALWGLLHDASETYLGDMVRPLKHAPEMQVFVDAEDRLDAVVAWTFGLEFPMPHAVRDADTWVLRNLELPDLRENHHGHPAIDERDFLARYHELTGVEERPTVIGLTGFAQSGKDTVGSFLIRRGFTRIAFADVMREMLLAIDPLVGQIRISQLVDSIGWGRAKTEVPEVRGLLQRLGTEAGRNLLGENIWVDTALEKIKPGIQYVITDVRFENEAEAIRALAGGEVWRVERPGTGPVNAHVSDAGIPPELVNRVIINDSTLGVLRKRTLDSAGLGETHLEPAGDLEWDD